MDISKDTEILKQMRAKAAEINVLSMKLSSSIEITYDTVHRTSIERQYPTPHLVVKAEERRRL